MAEAKPLDEVSGLDRFGDKVFQRPGFMALLVFLAIIMLPVAVWLDLNNLSSEVLRKQASELNRVITEFRGYYARNIVARVAANKGIAKPAHNYESIDGGIPIPATMSLELGSLVGGSDDNISYRFVSDEPFAGRAAHQLDEFESGSLKAFRDGRAADQSIQQVSGSILDRQVRIAVPVVMGQACVDCHNKHPDSPRRDWKVGDVRAIQTVSTHQPISANLFSFKYLLAYLLLAGFFGLMFSILQWRQANRFAALNGELEETNSFLASISLKISKYLSPQVYKSIFSGERDAVISTERKQLTVFFSDIEDFTISTERLQPETLTALLNEYFTEMTSIAEAHGGTVDKFIGDAILVFFGDPTTNGAAEDAKACLAMAIAMQQRLAEMNETWRRRGIEKPFRARMGINTGYCNVGNFGSDDRMDYTIIGAEANLAARLQTIAEPGGIVMSYETFALVQDKISAKPLEPITLKGISREIIPYSFKPLEPALPKAPETITEKIARMVGQHIDPLGEGNIEDVELEKAVKIVVEAVRRKNAGLSDA